MTKSYGAVRYNRGGLPVCEICGKSFDRLMAHVRQTHGMSAAEYKGRFGLDNIKGICSKRSSEKSRDAVYKHKSLCIDSNLTNGGASTRFKKGSKGRPSGMVREQTRLRLAERARGMFTTEERAALMKRNRREQ